LSGNSTLLIYPTLLIVLIIMTFLFGKIWCGWLCHIGALQEFLYKGERLQWLKSKKSQKILHIIQSSAVVILIIAILITKTNLVCQYFPFVNIFMLQIFNPITYFLVGLVIISSLLIYRPFCRTVCPVGLILNWVSRIPFAKRVRISECKECKRCHRLCKMGSIQGGAIDMSCIACGECSQANCETIQLTRKKDQKI
ncbi:MAG: 4Fe-4S binding protein, partial [Bacteroidales bacterium]